MTAVPSGILPFIGPSPRYTAILQDSGPRKALVGFVLSGMAVALPGALLPAWGYHQRDEFSLLSLYFLAMALGLVLAIRPAVLLFRRVGLGRTMATACLCLTVTLTWLAWFGPEYPHWTRVTGLLLLGFSVGILHTGIFRAIAPLYRHNTTATLNIAALFFSAGTILAATVFAIGAPTLATMWILLLLALVPLALIPFFQSAVIEHQRLGDPLALVIRDFRSPGAVLLGMVLIIQFGNEWCMGAWFAVFVVRLLGRSPATALWFLALYWILLAIARVAAQRYLQRMRPMFGLFSLLLAGFFGSLLLSSTDNRFGLTWGLSMVAISFGIVFPLVASQLGRKLEKYHPDFFHGVFSVAASGGLFAPAAIGFLAAQAGWSIKALVVIPFFGTLAIFLLIGVMMLERQMHQIEQFKTGVPRS